MQTRTLVSLIKREASSWGRELIRSLIDDVQTILLCHPLEQQRIISLTTGDDPLLSTTAATFRYYATAANIGTAAWRVERVYTGSIVDETDEDADVILVDGNYSNAAQIIFTSDPGTSTATYKVRAYKSPTSITSEDIELDVPQQYHITHVKEGVMGMIEQTDNGKSERFQNFLVNLVPDFHAKMNRSIKQHTKTKYDGGY